MKDKIFNGALLVSALIVSLIITLVIAMGISFVQSTFLVPNEYILYATKSPASKIVFLLEIEILVFIFMLFFKGNKGVSFIWVKEAWNFIKKYALAFAIGNVILIYICITSLTVVTKDKITDYKFYNLKGKSYTYDEITKVETGFKGKEGFKGGDKGEFYYKITFNDDKTINFENATSKYEDMYTEYVEFDEIVMKNKVTKISSTENSKYASLDKVYLDRLFKVINNK